MKSLRCLGARVVRIATNPEYLGMGYGSRALELLKDYFEGKFTDISESGSLNEAQFPRVTDEEIAAGKLSDEIKLRDAKQLPPLLMKLSEKPPYFLHYLGVLYGLTPLLHKFWKRAGYVPVYLRQTANELTGEHTMVMLNSLEGRDSKWLGEFARDFHRRFLMLLLYEFRKFTATQALAIIELAEVGEKDFKRKPLTITELTELFTPYDMKRLELYANNLLDYHVIVDLLPAIANLYFGREAGDLKLLLVQAAILLAIGLQRKDIDAISKELNLASNQSMAMFAKIIRKFLNVFRDLQLKQIAEEMPELKDEVVQEMDGEAEDVDYDAIEAKFNQDLEEAGDDAMKEMRERQKELINALDLDKYTIAEDAEWDEVLAKKAAKKGLTVAVKKATKRSTELAADIYEEEMKLVKRGKKSKK